VKTTTSQQDLWERPADILHFETACLARGYSRIAGLDEAGRGPLAGPVVAAAVILPPGERYPGITDSKKLRPADREKGFDLICEKALAYSICEASQEEVDRLNILVASRKAMERAVRGLSMAPGFLLIDGMVPLATDIPQECIKKGDQRSQSVAAASILAKVTRDRLMEAFHEQYPQYNFRKNKGYGTREHLQALQEHGACPIHRRSFRGVKELLAPEMQSLPSDPLYSRDSTS
jgi:ribonuclease HII